MSVSRRLTTAALAAGVVGASLGFASGAFARHGGRDDGATTPTTTTTTTTTTAAPVAERGHHQRGHHQRGKGNDDGADLRAPLVGSLPTDPAIDGVTPGGAPWVVSSGSVRLSSRGRLRVRVSGLVIPPPTGTNTPGPVTTITASVLCAGGTAAAATTTAVPLSATGGARIDQNVTLTGACVAPTVVVNPNGGVAKYIAVTGFGR